MDIENLKKIVEAILFISGKGMSVAEVAEGLDADRNDIKMVLDTLVDDFAERDGGILIIEKAGKYMFSTQGGIYHQIRSFIQEKKKETLSKSTMETLAIIAYNQPVTLTDVEEIRGVNSRSMVTTLLSKKLIKSVGNKEAPGRPLLYGTTKEFLEFFGLNSLEELPPPTEVKELNFEEL